MRVLLAGGSGLIGRRLAQRLSHDGYEVIVLSRTPQQKRHLLPEDTQVMYWDGKTIARVGDTCLTVPIRPSSTLLGTTWGLPRRWTMEHQNLVRSSRIDSTRAIVEAIHRAPISLAC
ncbi:MAG UNVERIFIED_CONTAM: NAD-dependent epimerase/dehydratase family protein [Anaerolineae bacterium]|jgi:NAD dependent epimerase/dehydratase family enzyme